MFLNADFFNKYYWLRRFLNDLGILKKYPEANVVSSKTQAVVRVFGVLILVLLIITPLTSYLLTKDVIVSAMVTLLMMVALVLPFLVILGVVDRKSNFNKVVHQISEGGKPKGYDPFLVNLNNIGLVIAVLLGIFVGVFFQVDPVRGSIDSFAAFFILKGIITIIRKRDYFRFGSYEGTWTEGEAAIKRGVVYIILGIIAIILTIYFLTPLDKFFITK